MRTSVRPSQADREWIIPMNSAVLETPALTDLASVNDAAVCVVEDDDVPYDEMCLDLGVGD